MRAPACSTRTGALLATARHPITVWHEAGSVVEQSSSEIWAACAASVRAAMAEAALPAVRRQGHRLRCDVLAGGARRRRRSADGQRVGRRTAQCHRLDGPSRDGRSARQVNDTQDDVLRYVGGSISPEMEIPKLLWLKRHLPSTYRSAGHFFDLADYLSFRATGSTARSICTLACKWNFLAHEQRWSESYFERIGLGDLASDDYARIGKEIVAPGTPLGAGLTESAAHDFGLLEGTPVGASLIDAHAGGVGTIGGRDEVGRAGRCVPSPRLHHGDLGLHHGDNVRAVFRPGRLGSLLLGNGSRVLAERRRTVRGRRGRSIISSGPIPPITRPSRLRVQAASKFWNFSSGASSRASKNPGEAALLARDIHVLPEFLGNRSPFADPDSRAIVAGHGSRRRHRLDGAAVRGRVMRACLRPCRCRRGFSVARRRQRLDGDQRRRRDEVRWSARSWPIRRA